MVSNCSRVSKTDFEGLNQVNEIDTVCSGG